MSYYYQQYQCSEWNDAKSQRLLLQGVREIALPSMIMASQIVGLPPPTTIIIIIIITIIISIVIIILIIIIIIIIIIIQLNVYLLT